MKRAINSRSSQLEMEGEAEAWGPLYPEAHPSILTKYKVQLGDCGA